LDKDIYKLFQLTDVFISKYEYSQVMIKQYQSTIANEAWLLNSSNTNYQVIRISFSNAVQYSYDEERINVYLDYFKKNLKNDDIKFLDIHISKSEYDASYEPYDYVNVEESFIQGVDIKNIYPEVCTCIHTVKDSNKEVTSILNKMTKNINSRVKSKPFFQRYPYIFTYITIAICVINYLISLYFKYNYNDTSSVFVFLGADYKMFTLCLKQYYRLITYSFVHNDIIHLFCNMLSLYTIGRYIEVKLGHGGYVCILLFSVISGGLTQGILSDNSICIGISAGVYGLLVAFLIEVVSLGAIEFRSLIPTICINLFLNFLSTTAWMAHLGGAIGGFVMYYYLTDKKNVYRLLLCVVLMLCLIFKYVRIDSIENIYAGTDFNVLKIYQDIGLDNYASKILFKLTEAYNKFGG